MLLILSLWTSYYLQIRRIRAVHETLVAIVAGMFVGLIIRLAPGTMIREMLVSIRSLLFVCSWWWYEMRAEEILLSVCTPIVKYSFICADVNAINQLVFASMFRI